MPEAPMYKYDRLVSWQNNIRAAWKIFAMQSEAQSGSMKKLPDCDLGFGVLPSYACHHSRAYGGRHNVDHFSSP